MIVKYEPKDFKAIYDIINESASAYKGAIPADRWQEPYMSEEALNTQLNQCVQFWCFREEDEISGVMGIQEKGDVTLIRHAYVRSTKRNRGIGSKLLAHLSSHCTTPILIGTWADAKWAITFYQKHGFHLVSKSETETLLRRYWAIPVRQIETSVVLASADWKSEGLFSVNRNNT